MEIKIFHGDRHQTFHKCKNEKIFKFFLKPNIFFILFLVSLMEMFSYFPSECKKKEERKKDKCRIEDSIVPVSYTHLTLPTILLV